ncbi:MAG: hypothetical protein ACK5JR_04780 [Tropicimonas sp.]|uniref:hypothetical protein n=1 Tax=Tropicimonas sp. TaxID=2067044 RepID=UPI003A8AC70F
MRAGDILLAPLLPWPVLWVACGLSLVLVVLAAWRGARGWWLRGLAATALLVAIANPSWQAEEREALSDIVLMVVDRSASQQIGGRAEQTGAAVERITAAIEALPDTELRQITLRDGAEDAGTLAMTALAELAAAEPRARIAGAILISDGLVHDIERAPDLPAPLHLLMTGRETDWDRRLVLNTAPAFAIVGEEVRLSLRVEESGAVPAEAGGLVTLSIGIDAQAPIPVQVPVGQDLDLPLTLSHGGMNVIRLEVATAPDELTDRNNAAVVQINGVRDRLRVLLVSGEPHAGERTWRNLLKSDSSVDLVHFTILRPPEKQDGVPVTELALIAFPTRELFLEKVDEFDLIIFDRYKRRGILPMLYLENVRNYVERGGAILVAAGPDFASADSLYHSPLAEILPAAPTARVIEEGYRPALTDTGRKHPVTEGLDRLSPPLPDGSEGPGWGRWFRLIELQASRGDVVMSGPGERPLLVLDRVGEGRVALLGSDHAWLWSRGFEGGGPQLELLRRLAHWTMKEPDLEEEALSAIAEGLDVTLTRRTLGEAPEPVEVTAPDGQVTTVPLSETAPGRYSGRFTGEEPGLYRLVEGELTSVVALGPAAPKEFEQTIATDSTLAPAIAAGRGGVMRLEEGLPRLRQVREGRAAAGRGWIGITPRGAYMTAGLTVMPLAAPLFVLLLATGLMLGAWLREGRH